MHFFFWMQGPHLAPCQFLLIHFVKTSIHSSQIFSNNHLQHILCTIVFLRSYTIAHIICRVVQNGCNVLLFQHHMIFISNFGMKANLYQDFAWHHPAQMSNISMRVAAASIPYTLIWRFNRHHGWSECEPWIFFSAFLAFCVDKQSHSRPSMGHIFSVTAIQSAAMQSHQTLSGRGAIFSTYQLSEESASLAIRLQKGS